MLQFGIVCGIVAIGFYYALSTLMPESFQGISSLELNERKHRLILWSPTGAALLLGEIASELDVDQIDVNYTKEVPKEGITCHTVIWTPEADNIRPTDCFSLNQAKWYGGGEVFEQRWPMNNIRLNLQPFVSNDLGSKSGAWGSLLEPYWLLSNGVAIYVPSEVPLHVGINKEKPDHLCLRAAFSAPYKRKGKERPVLKYHMCSSANFVDLHRYMLKTYLGHPTELPDENILKKPIWSTWAQFGDAVTQKDVLKFANDIVKRKFPFSFLEIDDIYSTKYGDMDFDTAKFPDAAVMTRTLHNQGFKVSAWVHPFVNQDAAAHKEGSSKAYWVGEEDNNAGLVTWWRGQGNVIDFTDDTASDWFRYRLNLFKHKYDVDSFKFDAGEAQYLPPGIITEKPLDTPNDMSKHYVKFASQFGKSVEVRVGYESQSHPIFVRIMDRSSTWSHVNGLQSILPTVFLFGLLGYPYVLPDMIGGNVNYSLVDAAGVKPKPDKELFIRWMELNAYLPVMQFSYAPWKYDAETVAIAQKMIKIHEEVVAPLIIEVCNETFQTGDPIIRPLWWTNTKDKVTLMIDDEFFVGDKLLVAPVLEHGALKRDIYLPKGAWLDLKTRDRYVGPKWIRDYPVPLDHVPTFKHWY